MKFNLKPNPTFPAKVEIHVPGQEKPQVIVFTFRHMSRDELKKFQADVQDKSDEDAVMMIAQGWDVEDTEFSREAVAELVCNFHTSAASIMQAFMRELVGARVKN